MSQHDEAGIHAQTIIMTRKDRLLSHLPGQALFHHVIQGAVLTESCGSQQRGLPCWSLIVGRKVCTIQTALHEIHMVLFRE
jgi:hypothetical protein